MNMAKTKPQRRRDRRARKRGKIKHQQRTDPEALELPSYAVKPTAERKAKVDPEFITDEPTEIAGTMATRVRVLDAFDHYYHRRYLMNPAAKEDEQDNQRRYDAGMKLREDFRRAGLPSKVIANYSDMVASGSIQGYADGSIDARKRFFEASGAVDPQLWWTVRDTAVEGRAVGKGCLDRLRIGLEQLCRHYGS
jgi:hypothetical protein